MTQGHLYKHGIFTVLGGLTAQSEKTGSHWVCCGLHLSVLRLLIHKPALHLAQTYADVLGNLFVRVAALRETPRDVL